MKRLEEFMSERGSLIIAAKVPTKVGDIIPFVYDNPTPVYARRVEHPFVVIRIATREEYLAQEGHFVAEPDDVCYLEVTTD